MGSLSIDTTLTNTDDCAAGYCIVPPIRPSPLGNWADVPWSRGCSEIVASENTVVVNTTYVSTTKEEDEVVDVSDEEGNVSDSTTHAANDTSAMSTHRSDAPDSGCLPPHPQDSTGRSARRTSSPTAQGSYIHAPYCADAYVGDYTDSEVTSNLATPSQSHAATEGGYVPEVDSCYGGMEMSAGLPSYQYSTEYCDAYGGNYCQCADCAARLCMCQECCDNRMAQTGLVVAPDPQMAPAHYTGHRAPITRRSLPSIPPPKPKPQAMKFAPPPPPPMHSAMMKNPLAYEHIMLRWYTALVDNTDAQGAGTTPCPAPDRNVWAFDEWCNHVGRWWDNEFYAAMNPSTGKQRYRGFHQRS